jgi:predicted  nucleic acid-binding Zn-ribbon protein
VKARPADQRALLDVVDLDIRIRQAVHALSKPAQAPRLAALQGEIAAASRVVTELLGAKDDADLEVARIEADVKVVSERRARDEARLAASTNPKDAQALESELDSLARRTRTLEDAELEAMERVESAAAAVADAEAIVATLVDERDTLEAAAGAEAAVQNQRRSTAERDRAGVAAGVPADLLARYDLLATRNAGAALLRRRTCEGCRMELSGTELQAVRSAADDDVVECPQCGCILVRTEESGL